MKGVWIRYSDEELAWLQENRAWSRPVLHEIFVLVFDRPDVGLENLKSLMNRRGWTTGRTGRFEKGVVPANKGKPCPPGTGGRHPNAQRTQFKKGNRSGTASEIYKPIGTERLSKEGYVERKIHDGLPMQSRWQAVHRIEWERLNGPIPAGHCLKCLDGDKTNVAPSNWELIPRALLPRLAGAKGAKLAFDQAAPEVKPVIMALARVQHGARKARKRRKEAA